MELNTDILTEAIKLVGAEGLQYHVLSVARVPGNTCLLMIKEDAVFPDEQTKLLNRLMGEKVRFVRDHSIMVPRIRTTADNLMVNMV